MRAMQILAERVGRWIAGLVSALAVLIGIVGGVVGGVGAAVGDVAPGTRVLIVGDGSSPAWLSDVQSKVAASLGLGSSVDTFNIDGGGTPTLNLLKGYDVVLVYTDAGTDDSVALGNVLADYVDAAGNVVEMTFGFYDSGAIGIQGRWRTGGYSGMTAVSQLFNGVGTGTRLIPSHEILSGVSAVTATYRNTGTPAAGVTRVADWSDGTPMVMTVPGKNGRIASLNFYPVSTTVFGSGWDAATQGGRLMANACRWASGNNVDVLILGSPFVAAWLDEVKSTIRSFGRVGGKIDTFNIATGTPTAAQLAAYDSVLVFSDAASANPVALGNLLADYADQGGGVVVSPFSNVAGLALQGRFVSGGYLPQAVGGSTTGAATLGAVSIPNHPLMRGVTSFNGGSSSYRAVGGLTPGATLVASWSTGQPLLAIKRITRGRVVTANFYPASSVSRADFWPVSTDGGAILGNALTWSARRDNDTLLLGENGLAGTSNDVAAKIRENGFTGSITFFDCSVGTPSLSYLKRFDSVMVWTNSSAQDSATLGTVLSHFVDSGGGVVNTLFTNASSYALQGRWATLGYSAMTTTNYGFGTRLTMGEVDLPGHPVMDRVATFDNGSGSFYAFAALMPGATQISRYTNGTPLVAENSIRGNGRVVTLNFFPGSGSILSGLWEPSSDGGRLMANALRHVARSDDRVLIAGSLSGSELEDVRMRVAATGRFRNTIDTYSIGIFSALPSDLSTGYDSIMIGNNNSIDSVILGDQFADFVDAGGGVVTVTGAHAGATFGLAGRWINGGYSPYPAGNGSVYRSANPTFGVIHRPGHPLLTGVDSFNGGVLAAHDAATLAPGADPIVDFNTGYPLAAERKRGPIQSVGLNFFMDSSATAPGIGWETGTDGALLLANALTYVSSPRPCDADFNGDGFIDAFDYEDFVECFEGGRCPRGVSADFNHDGFPDAFDYDDFVAAFEAGC